MSDWVGARVRIPDPSTGGARRGVVATVDGEECEVLVGDDEVRAAGETQPGLGNTVQKPR